MMMSRKSVLPLYITPHVYIYMYVIMGDDNMCGDDVPKSAVPPLYIAPHIYI